MTALVVGAGGLLGRAVCRALRAEDATAVGAQVDWSSPRAAVRDLQSAIRATSGSDGPTEIYWCAGAGVTSTPREALMAEVDVFRQALSFIRPTGPPASVFLASSVGGIWAGAAPAPFDEHTPPAPVSDYGITKLAMEDLLRRAVDSGRARAVVGRVSNLYGPDQNVSKSQGLVSVMARATVTNAPVPVYVSLDTIRDYIHADDAGRLIVAAMKRLRRSQDDLVTKVVASGTGTSIGSLLAEFRRIRHRRVLVVSSAASSAGQAPDLRVRSRVWTDLDALVRTTLPEGIADLLQRSMQMAGAGTSPAVN